MIQIFFFYRLVPLGLATADCLLSSHSISNILFCRFCGLSLVLLPGSSIFSILCPVYPLYFLCTCPNCLNLASLTLSLNHSTSAVPHFSSIPVSPNKNLSIFNSASCLCCKCQTTHHSRSQYHIVNLSFHSCSFLLSQITPIVVSNRSTLSSSPLLSTQLLKRAVL